MLANNLKQTVRRSIQLLPPRFRLLTDVTLSSLTLTNEQWHMPSYLVRGQLHGVNSEGTLIYCGQLPQYKSWIASYFSVADEPAFVGTYSLLKIAKHEERLSMCDAIVCPINPISQLLFSSRHWFYVPKYVECLIDLHKPTDQLFRRHGAKDDLRIVKKKNYSFKVLRGDDEFDEFYSEMLIPTSLIRHEERAHISALENLRAVFRNGYLLAAYLDSKWVAASLLVPQAGNTLSWANIGWRDGNEMLMKDRVVSALLYEMIIRGKGEGFDTLNLGSCNPFVNDGPLNFKLKWGAHLALPALGYEHDRLVGLNAYIAAHFNLGTEGGRSMLRSSPILDKHAGNLRAIGFDSTLRADFKHQVDQGLPWVDLASVQ